MAGSPSSFFCFFEAEMILNINLPSSGRADVLLWHYDKLVVYSVKSGYWLACDSLDQPSSSMFSESGSWWHFLWALHFPATACKSLRAVREDCNFLAFSSVLGAQPVLEFFLSCKVLNPVADFELLAIVWWRSWFRENKMVRKKGPFPAVDVEWKLRSFAFSFQTIVAILEPSLAEALAVCIGMKLAIENGLLPAMVKSDLIFVVNLILAGLPIRSEIGLIIDDILNLKATHDFPSFGFSPRDSNRVAHNLAKMIVVHAIDVVLFEDIPPGIRSFVQEDAVFC
ncbi:hypothetical protein ACOSP7_020469 [Xanthoceras sorbifolium]